MKRLAPFLLLLACAKPEATPFVPEAGTKAAPQTASIDDVAGALITKINARDAEGSVALFAPSMRAAFSVESQREFIAQVLDTRGKLGAIKRTSIESDGRAAVYVVAGERGDVVLDLNIDEENRITGFSIKNAATAASASPPVAKSSVPLGLPFKGEWFVFWGGDTKDVNHHVPFPDQRRAADLSKVDASGKTHKGDGKRNEDYFVYGQDVLAVADGVVTMVVDGIPDNDPGSRDREFVPGNTIIMKHRDDLFSAYGHLQPGKQRVRVGDEIKRGDVLGIAGNSGNSSEPHLHFQLQDAPRFEASWGVEAIFSNVNVVRDGKASKMASYTFLKGDRISP